MTKVLVIDDEAPIRLLCRVNLEAEKMDVIEAADGPSGVEKARAERPDVILLDVMMPGLDGWNVAAQLLEDTCTRGIPITFLTARAEFREGAAGDRAVREVLAAHHVRRVTAGGADEVEVDAEGGEAVAFPGGVHGVQERGFGAGEAPSLGGGGRDEDAES